MALSWIERFFNAMRKFDSTIEQRLAGRTKAETFDWKDTGIVDHLTPEDWRSMDKEMSEQIEQRNDRGVAITYLAVVEDRLRWVLEIKFIPGLSRAKLNWIFNGVGPLSSFVAKTEIAYALGLIPENFRDELLLLAQIRNKFAHNFRRVRFEDPEVKKLCDRLEKFDHDEKNELYGDLLKRYGMHCFVAMVSLFTIGQMLARASRPPASPDKRE